MSLHKLKDDFQFKQEDVVIVKDKVFVEENILYLKDNDNTIKFENNEWSIKTPLTNNEYIPLGLGALPTYYIEDTGIEDIDEFNSLFELCNEEKIN